MKVSNIIGLIAIAMGIGVLISMTASFSEYTNFATAVDKPNEIHQIIGELSLEDPIVYNPQIDPNSFSFHMVDKKGMKKKVICQRDKPQDFERSEQVILKGRMNINEDVFLAHEVQLKCPSKYQDEALQNESKKLTSKKTAPAGY